MVLNLRWKEQPLLLTKNHAPGSIRYQHLINSTVREAPLAYKSTTSASWYIRTFSVWEVDDDCDASEGLVRFDETPRRGVQTKSRLSSFFIRSSHMADLLPCLNSLYCLRWPIEMDWQGRVCVKGGHRCETLLFCTAMEQNEQAHGQTRMHHPEKINVHFTQIARTLSS